jgi:hypothetical protein
VERLPDAAEACGRRTCRMDVVAHHLGLALGGRPAARMAQKNEGQGGFRFL